jgi:hypothetical protein
MRRTGAACLLAFSLASFHGIVHAAPGHGIESAEKDAERAEGFFVEGRSAMKARRYEEACAKFAESHRLDPASGTLLNLAVCREAQGRTATAWTHYWEGLVLSKKEANLEGERFALERLHALEPTLCRLTIYPPTTEPTALVITLDGARLDPKAWGSAKPVDPGTHVVVASAPGRESWTGRVSLVEQGSRRVLSVPPLRVLPSSAPPRAGASPRADGAGFRWDVAVPGALSVAGFASTAYFGLRAKAEWDTRNEHCPGGICSDRAVAASDRSNRFARISNVSAAVGIAGAGVAVYFLVFPLRKGAVSGVPLNVRVTSDHLTVRGVF